MATDEGFFTRLVDSRAEAGQADTEDYIRIVRETVDELISRETTSRHPGMLLGKIQSGKTRAFWGIIADGFDRGFDVAIVLTKGTKTLAHQTVNRIRKDFHQFREDGLLEAYDIMSLPDLTSYEIEEQKLIFVAKKEANNMRRLLELFLKTQPALKNKRVLIIDDEADFASLRFTKKKGEEEINQGTIADQIDGLRRDLERSSFLQVTATPYSLYLQPEDYERSPGSNFTFEPKRPAFTKLVPIHATYVGGDHYFGEHEPDEPEYYLWHPVDEDELSALKKEDRRRVKTVEALTSQKISAIRHALITFVTAGTIRRLQQAANSERQKRYAMIVHVETSRNSHTWQHTVVGEVLTALRVVLERNDPLFDKLLTTSIEDLSRSVKAEGLIMPATSQIRSEVRDAFLRGAVVTEKVNSDNDVMALLDENAELKLRTPFNVFIGGQILDRGITVPNLIGFYYGRSPKKMQQDTVLQHARMYGARPRPDLAVTRFYTTAHNHVALTRIHGFDAALREAFETGAHDRGVAFIHKDLSNRVQPCAPNKILMSDITALRPGRAYLPFGFQTIAKTYLTKVTEEIDRLLPSAGKKEDGIVKAKVDDAIRVIDLIEKTFEFENGYSFDWEACRAAIEYYSRIAAPDADKGTCWLLAVTGRRLSRMREGGRFSNAPHTKQQSMIAETMKDKLPIVMFFRQEGSQTSGWRDAPFWWPVFFPPANAAPTIFAASFDQVDD